MNDINYRSYSDQEDVKIVAETIEPPHGPRWDDTLKFSNCRGIDVSFSNIHGGSEDAIDFNRHCKNALIYKCNIYATGECGITIKGGSSNINIWGCTFHGNPTSGYDIDLGNWSDQSDDKTRLIFLEDLHRADGGPVRVRVLWSQKPTVVGGNVKLTVVPLWLVSIYRFFRGLFP